MDFLDAFLQAAEAEPVGSLGRDGVKSAAVVLDAKACRVCPVTEMNPELGRGRMFESILGALFGDPKEVMLGDGWKVYRESVHGEAKGNRGPGAQAFHQTFHGGR